MINAYIGSNVLSRNLLEVVLPIGSKLVFVLTFVIVDCHYCVETLAKALLELHVVLVAGLHDRLVVRCVLDFYLGVEFICLDFVHDAFLLGHGR